MAAPQERPGAGIPLLEYGDLVSLGRIQLGLNPILEPNRIPVHPLVFKSPQLYTTEFAQRVFVLVPDSIKQDIAAIEAKVGQKVPVALTTDGIHQEGEYEHEELFKDFTAWAHYEGNQVGIQPHNQAGAINTWIRRSEPRCNNYPSLPKKLKREYEVDPTEFMDEGVLIWNAHNIGDASLPLLLVLRNFAIMFNNLGLQELGIK